MHQRVALVHKTFSIISNTLYRLYVFIRIFFFSLRSLLFSFVVCYYFCNIAPHDFCSLRCVAMGQFFRETNEFELNIAKNGEKVSGAEPLPRSMTKTSLKMQSPRGE